MNKSRDVKVDVVAHVAQQWMNVMDVLSSSPTVFFFLWQKEITLLLILYIVSLHLTGKSELFYLCIEAINGHIT